MNIIGHKNIINSLNSALGRGLIDHAYIFSGPQSVGKFTLARIFAENIINGAKNMEIAINFSEESYAKTMFDLIVLRPDVEEKNKIVREKNIPVEKVREVQSKLSFFPQSGNYRVLVVDGADLLTISAQNALLKTLEEPNSTSVIILVVHDENFLLSTVMSRCQTIRFSLVDNDDMRKETDGMNNENELILLASGRPGFLVKMLNDEDFFSERMEMKNTLKKAMEKSISQKFLLAQEFSKDIPRAKAHLEAWLYFLRETTEASGWKNVKIKMEIIGNTLDIIKKTNANARLILENLFLNLN